MIPEALTEDVAVIVITHQQPQRNFQLVEVLLEVIKSLGLAPMCQITRDDTTLGIRMIPVDISDTALKRRCRIAAVQRLACGDKVGVGEVNDFHSSGRIFRHNNNGRSLQLRVHRCPARKCAERYTRNNICRYYDDALKGKRGRNFITE